MMASLFWILWVIDLVIALLSVLGKDFRRSFTATDPTFWFHLLLIGSIIGGLLLRLVFKRSVLGLALVALPLLVLLVWYLIDKAIEPNV